MDNTLSKLYRQLSIKHRIVVQTYLDELHLYIGQPRFLFELSANPGISQGEVSSRLHLSKETVSVTLKRLENAGFVLRKQSLEDKRIKLLYLSEKGEKVVVELRENFDRINNTMFSKLSEEEKEMLESMLLSMMEGLEDKELNT